MEKKFLLAQTQLLLFSDNLIEEMARPHEADAAFYDNEQYKSPETSPPGMQDSEYYPNPGQPPAHGPHSGGAPRSGPA